MKNLTLILILSLVVLAQSCSNKNNCEDFLCNSGPASFQLELVDKDSGENLFTNGTFSQEDLEVTNTSGTEAEYRFSDENNLNFLQISTFESVAYSVKINGTEIFKISIDAEGVTKDCCFHTEVNEFKIENADFEQDQNTGIYKVKI